MKFISELKEHKIRALKTLLTCLCYVCIGLQSSVIGVALLDLQILSGCEFSQISFILTAFSVGYAAGSISAGFLESKLNIQLAIAASLIITAICQLGYPLTGSLAIMIFIGATAGFFSGVADCFSNIFILKLWGKECPPFLQALHFSYGVGSFISPLIAGPFLKETGETELTGNISFSANVTMTPPRPEDVQLIIPFSIISAFTAGIAICFVFLYVRYRETTDHPSRNNQTNNGKVDIKFLDQKVKRLIVVLAAVSLVLYGGLEQAFGNLLPPYAHDGPLQLTKQVAANIASIFWVLFTCFRMVAVLMSGVLGSLTMLFFNAVTTVFASFLLATAQTNLPVFWFTSALMGVGLSSTFGTMFAYLESQFPVDGKIVSLWTVGSRLGCSASPAIIGYLMGLDVTYFAWFPLVFSLGFLIIISVIYFSCKIYLYTNREVGKCVVVPQTTVILFRSTSIEVMKKRANSGLI